MAEKIEPEIAEEIEKWLKREEPFYLKDWRYGAKCKYACG